jgi:hypothetical protein
MVWPPVMVVVGLMVVAVGFMVVAVGFMGVADFMGVAGFVVVVDALVSLSAVPSFGRRIITLPPITLPPTMPILTITPRVSQCNPHHPYTRNRAARSHPYRQHRHNSHSRIGGTTALIRRCTTPM